VDHAAGPDEEQPQGPAPPLLGSGCRGSARSGRTATSLIGHWKLRFAGQRQRRTTAPSRPFRERGQRPCWLARAKAKQLPVLGLLEQSAS
jgi:hypothetical protein